MNVSTRPAGPPAQSLPDRLRVRAKKIVTAPELGEVVELEEARLGDIMPFMKEASDDPQSFLRRVMMASVSIDGTKLSQSLFDDMGMRAWQSLQALIPDVLEINGMQTPGATPPKKG